MVSGEIAGMLQKNTETDFEQKVTEITEELGRNRSHHGTQGIKGRVVARYRTPWNGW
jgi:hypothetical protein